MKKDNEKYNIIYEGNNANCFIGNFNNNINYKFRICTSYNNLDCNRSKNITIKSIYNDNILLVKSKRKNEFINKIYE